MALGEVVIEDGEEFYICENPPSQAELEAYFKENGNGLDPLIMGVDLASHLVLQPIDNPKKAVLGVVDQLELSAQEWFRFRTMMFWGLAAILTSREAVPTASCQSQGMK